MVEQAGACRTVDADDLIELCQAIARQESIAEQQALEQGVSCEQESDTTRIRLAEPLAPA